MLNIFVVLLAGMVACVVAKKIVRKKYPDGMDRLFAKACWVASEVKEDFKDGYRTTAKTREPFRD